MAIEDATNQLRNENQSGLDRRLLLPTVAAEQTQQGQSQSDKLFKSLNELTVTFSDKTDLVIDQLVELNDNILKMGDKVGGGRENILQTVTRLPGRAISGARKAVSSGISSVRDIVTAPFSLATGAVKSTLGGIGGAIAAGPKAITNTIGNLFQSKSMKALVDINQKALEETTAIKDINEKISENVEDIAKMIEREYKLKRRGRLDALEAERDKRNKLPGFVVPTPSSRRTSALEATVAGGAGGAGGDGGDGGKPTILQTIAKTLGLTFAGGVGIAGGIGTGRLLSRLNPVNLFRSKPLAPSVGNINVPNPAASNLKAPSATQYLDELDNAKPPGQPRSGFLSKLTTATKFAGPLAAAVTGGLGLFDQERKDAGMDAPSRVMSGITEGVLGLGDLGANLALFGADKTAELFGGNLDYRTNLAGGFRDKEIENAKEGQLIRRGMRRNSALNTTFETKEEAIQAAEENNISDYSIQQVERRNFLLKKVPGFRIKEIDPKVRKMMDINVSPSTAVTSNYDFGLGFLDYEGGGNLPAMREGSDEFKQIHDVDYTTSNSILEKISAPREISNLQQENLQLASGGGNVNIVAPATDMRNQSSTVNNSTVLNKTMSSTVDDNKVIPI